MTSIANMGCGSSTGGGTNGTEPILSKADEDLIRQSWSQFQKGDVVEDGLHLYFKFFEKNPEAKNFFGFAKEEAVTAENRQFRSHVKNVFDIVGGAVDNMDNIPELKAILFDLGVRHHSYGVPKKYFEVIGTSLVYALDRKLNMDSKTKKAWVRLYTIIHKETERGMDSVA